MGYISGGSAYSDEDQFNLITATITMTTTTQSQIRLNVTHALKLASLFSIPPVVTELTNQNGKLQPVHL